jgi:threonine synthase
MDIQVSSNFERLLFEAYDRDAGAVRTLMNALAQSGRFTIAPQALSRIRADFSAGRADEEDVAATIRTLLRESGHLVDPHTAVGIAVAEKEQRDPATPMVILSTAHAAKFPDAVRAACGATPALPEWLGDLPRRAEKVTHLPADQTQIERCVLAASRAAREGVVA